MGRGKFRLWRGDARSTIRMIALVVFALTLNAIVSEAALAASRFHP